MGILLVVGLLAACSRMDTPFPVNTSATPTASEAPPAVISFEPVDTPVRRGGTAALGVRSPYADATYRWFRQRSGSSRFTRVATTRRLVVKGVAANQDSQYRVVVRADGRRATSVTVAVRVVDPTATPVADYLSRLGTDATLQTGDDAVGLQGVDISYYNPTGASAEAAAAGWQFEILKSGGSDGSGGAYPDSTYKAKAAAARAAGLRLGHYWYNGRGSAKKDAEAFVKGLSNYKSGDPLVLDIEPYTGKKSGKLHKEWGPKKAARFLTRVGELLPGANRYVYMTARTTHAHDWTPVARVARLWVASWGKNLGRVPAAEPDIGTWDTWTIWQYSSYGLPAGFSGRAIDVDIARNDAWTTQ
jgi:GH25 family lysozyme M1 (1,4-beta-N-acetylmuramidase)